MTSPPMKNEQQSAGECQIHIRIMLNVVVFPAPFGPSRAKSVFCDTPKLALSTTRLSALPYALTTLSTRRVSFDVATFIASSYTSFLLPAWTDLRLSRRMSADVAAFAVFLRGRTAPESTQTRIPKRTKA